METKVKLVLCTVLFLTCVSHLGGQSTTDVPSTPVPGHPGPPVISASPSQPASVTTETPVPESTVAPNQNLSFLNSSTAGPDNPVTNDSTAGASDPNNTVSNSSSGVGTSTDTPVNPPLYDLNQTSTVALPGSTSPVPTPSPLIDTTLGGGENKASQTWSTPPASTQLPLNSTSLTSMANLTSTLVPQSVTTAGAQTRLSGGGPSQLTVKDDGQNPGPLEMSPDPLLTSLVSVFVLTAVIISLLLFLKFRRDNQPEFRRLQDLPMDDMMEDTPLSMYSY